MKKVLAFTGSNSLDSINEKLINSIIKENQDREIEFIDLKDYNVPIYSSEIESNGIPEPIKELHSIFIETNAFIIASPEHNGLPSAFFKNIIDWLSRIDQQFFGNKHILLLSTSPGATGGSTHLGILENLIKRWGGLISGKFSLGSFSQNFDVKNLAITNNSEKEKLEKTMEIFWEAVLEKNQTFNFY